MNLQSNLSDKKAKPIFFYLIFAAIVSFGLASTINAQSGSGELTKSSSNSKSKNKKKITPNSSRSTSVSKNTAVKNTSKSKITRAKIIVLKANFRIYPGNDADSLGTVGYGEILQVLDKKHVNGWYNVKHIQTNITGWVYGNTIEFIR